VRDLALAVLGCVAFLLITLFEQAPVLGWLGWALSIVAWWLLGRAASTTLTAALIGASTGLFGAFTSWLAQTGNLFGLTTPAGDRVGALFGFIGSLLGLVYWPLIGAAVCAVAARYATRLRLPFT
jgi:hypothetical protein